MTVLAADAYGHGLAPRTVVPIRGPLRHGDSGGPVLDRHGRVLAMMFAANQNSSGGFGIPVEDIVDSLPRMTGQRRHRALHRLAAAQVLVAGDVVGAPRRRVTTRTSGPASTASSESAQSGSNVVPVSSLISATARSAGQASR